MYAKLTPSNAGPTGSRKAAAIALRSLGVAGLLVSSTAQATGTLAGTGIINVASMSYVINDAAPHVVTSNSAMFRVDEIVDVVLSPVGGDVAVASGDVGRVLAFRLTNSGNGPEAYRLAGSGTIAGDAFDPAIKKLAFDTNGDGLYDPAIDVTYVAGVNDPMLGPDQSILIFQIADVPGALEEGDRGLETLTATAETGTGAPGTLFAGAGVSGGDALIGTNGARADAQGALVASLAPPSLLKAQTVLAPDGSASALPGAIITYVLTAAYSGGLVATDAAVSDLIPAGTTYVAGSLTLDGRSLTDSPDGDAGRAIAGGIEVRLAHLAPGIAPVVTFKVRVNN